MIKEKEKIQVKKNKRNIPINPRSTKTTLELRFHNKNSNNEPLASYQQKVSSTIENNSRANNNKVPPNSEKKFIQKKSAELMKYKINKIQIKKKECQKQIKIKNKVILNSNQNSDLKQEIGGIKSDIGEIKSGIGRIESDISEIESGIEEISKGIENVNNSLNDLKNILIKGFETAFSLLQNNMNQFEEKKNFQDSKKILNKNR